MNPIGKDDPRRNSEHMRNLGKGTQFQPGRVGASGGRLSFAQTVRKILDEKVVDPLPSMEHKISREGLIARKFVEMCQKGDRSMMREYLTRYFPVVAQLEVLTPHDRERDEALASEISRLNALRGNGSDPDPPARSATDPGRVVE